MGERIKYATTLDKELLRLIKILAVNKEMGTNDLLEEGIRLVLRKYENEESEGKKEI